MANGTNDADTCFKYNTAFLVIGLKKQERNKAFDPQLGTAHNQMGTAWTMEKDFVKATMAFQEATDTS